MKMQQSHRSLLRHRTHWAWALGMHVVLQFLIFNFIQYNFMFLFVSISCHLTAINYIIFTIRKKKKLKIEKIN